MASPVHVTKEFRRVMYEVAQQLSLPESDMLVWMHSLPVAFKGKPPLTVLAQMESMGQFSASKPDGLADVLRDINRVDLAKKAKEFTKNAKRKKNRELSSAVQLEEHLHITLLANYEVTLLQTKILVEQLERLREGVAEAQTKKEEEAICSAKVKATELQKIIQHAADLSRGGAGSDGSPSPNSSDEETHSLTTCTQGNLKTLFHAHTHTHS